MMISSMILLWDRIRVRWHILRLRFNLDYSRIKFAIKHCIRNWLK